EVNGIEPTSDIILKHHHLSDIRYEHSKFVSNSNSETDQTSTTDWARILIEGWNAEIIVTTFVQFFHTLVSYHNRCLRKFHRLVNSIIILDEVQSIPIKFWLLTRKLLLDLTSEFNSYVILVTATQPLIFEPGEIKNLCNHRPYFEALNRIKIIPRVQVPTTLDELAVQFNLEEKTHLFIFNTISSAKSFYNKLIEENLVHKSDITFLSAHIIPKIRRERIEKIKRKDYKVVVTTQLVEAGVDIDFDVVVRDIAPLDSIIQSAGRCNRNADKQGEVFVYTLVENNKRFANYIYDKVLLDITESILKSKNHIDEPEVLDLAHQYFIETTRRKSSDIANELLESISNLIYDHPDDDVVKVRDFNLIEDG
ncbi:MAG: CRISPR-associated helicase Cas3', partial [Candidatus Kapaibacteriota bacterium]